MATLFITEYLELPVDSAGRLIPIPQEPALVDQTVSFTTATQCAAFNSKTKFVRLYCADTDAYLKFGDNPTATASTAPVPAGAVEWRGVMPGQKLSVYDGSS